MHPRRTGTPAPAGPEQRRHETITSEALRASDHDRDETASRLRHAAAEGRLLPEELETRLDAVFSARTYGDLGQIVSDLPPRSARDRRRPIKLVPLRAAIALGAAIVLMACLLVAAALGLGLRRASVAAPHQPPPPALQQMR